MRGQQRAGTWISAFVLALAMGAPARAGLVLTVNTEEDGVDAAVGDGRCRTAAGACTLRAAVQEANATAGRDDIVLPPGYYSFELPGDDEDAAATGDLDVADDVSLRGAAANVTFIDARSLDGVLHVLPGVNAEISGVTIHGGLHRDFSYGAGGIFNEGTLHLVDSVVAGNAAPIAYGTGGLLNFGTATIERTDFEDNSPTAISTQNTLFLSHVRMRFNGPGAAVASDEATLTIVASEIADQTGNAAIFHQGGPALIQNTRIHHTRPGAAILVPGGQVTVLDSVIDHNQGGGIDNDGGLRVERCLFEANSREDGSGTAATTAGLAGTVGETAVTNTDGAIIVSSTIVGHRGGGLRNEQGNMALINVTVSGNSAPRGAGGVTNEGTMEIRSSTITANQSTDGTSAGGLVSYEDSADSLTIANTIVAGNTDLDSPAPDCAGPIMSLGHNIIGDPAGCTDFAAAGGDLIGVDPDLEPLADNGGPTPTHSLRAGSPALDAGDPAAPDSDPAACPSTDQRNVGRPRGTACDIGAFEATFECGNGVLDAGEACDDGNLSAGDCCSPLCTIEPLAGDCNGDGAVSVDELILAVDMALASPPPTECLAADADGDGILAINDLIAGVQSALDGCQAPPASSLATDAHG
jgi:cysteine-rich repeat protein